MRYEKSQTGWIMIVLIGALMAISIILRLASWTTTTLTNDAFIGLMLLFLIILALFYKMKIRVEENKILIIYGIGLIKIKIQPEKITNIESLKTPWWYGWGIRLTPKGWLYNIHGNKAVYFNYVSSGKEKRVMLGTDEPEELIKKLKESFSK